MALTQFAFMAADGAAPISIVEAGTVVEGLEPNGTSQETTATARSGQSMVRVATDTPVFVSFGAAPNATTDPVRFYMPTGQVEYFRVPPGAKAAVVEA